jgi:hypothetical protein
MVTRAMVERVSECHGDAFGAINHEWTKGVLRALLALDDAAREHICELIEDYDFDQDDPTINRLRACLLKREGE